MGRLAVRTDVMLIGDPRTTADVSVCAVETGAAIQTRTGLAVVCRLFAELTCSRETGSNLRMLRRYETMLSLTSLKCFYLFCDKQVAKGKFAASF